MTTAAVKRVVKAVLPLLPARVRRSVYERAAALRLAQARQRKQRTQVSLAEIADALGRLPLSGDLIVHSSLSNLGGLTGGTPRDVADLVVARLDLARTTLLAPALPFRTSLADYLEHQPEFDVRTATNAMGAISNLLMQREGCLRSLHPTHSALALGARASYYIDGHEKDPTPFGPGSPFAKLSRNRGKILMLGVGLNSVTNTHVYEDLLADELPFRVYQARSHAVNCIDRSGRRCVVHTPCHASFLAARRDVERARARLQRGGHIVTRRLGESEISLLDARGLTATLLAMLLEGDSIYGAVKLSARQAAAVERCLAQLPWT